MRRFALAFGSNVDLLLQGGSNYWKSYSEEYLTTWFVEKSNDTSSDVLLIQKASQNYTEVYVSIKCQNPLDLGEMSKDHNYTIHF